ncbi:MAG TPA: hypothetical protein VIN10_05270 [Bacteroidales bacterium]
MEPTAYYYFFSTTAQVIAAFAALTAIFIQFKINSISSYLLGDGLSVLRNIKTNPKAPGYDFKEITQQKIDRLDDAVNRKSLNEIFNVINFIAKLEGGKKPDDKRDNNIRGLNNKFKQKLNMLLFLRSATIISIVVASIAIYFALIYITKVDEFIKDGTIDNHQQTVLVLTFFSIGITAFGAIISMVEWNNISNLIKNLRKR